MKKTILFLLFTLVSNYVLNAQLFCPDDIVVSCLSDLTPDECGMATVVSGNYHPSMVKYVDQDLTNACNQGVVYRRFYLDVDFSNTYSDNEPSCTQTITMVYSSLPLNIQFPTDKEYTCVDEIPEESPTWLHNPCDLVGYTYEDKVYEFEEGACLKIVRTYHVINWCIYDVNASEGLYEGIQIIKIIDEMPPEIENCEDAYFDAGANCETMVTLTNSATDSGDCPSGTLTWRVSVDLWGDGTQDLFYGPNEPFPFRLDPVANGATVEIDIPDALATSRNKIVWKVTDGCGNVRSCDSEFFVEDNKPPTPYCINFTSSTLNASDGGNLTVPVSLFSLDAIDNCSSRDEIILSFSENINDTERVIECGDTGLQFFRIYYTDKEGNQDFCEVFMLIFDNGSCSGRYAPDGMITKPNGTPIMGAEAYLKYDDDVISSKESDEIGFFTFGEQDLMEDYAASVKLDNGGEADVDIEDFILMRSALIGLSQLDFYQKVAADIDGNKTFDIDDLYSFKDVILGKSSIENEDFWTFIPQIHEMNSSGNNLDFSEEIPYSDYAEGFDFFGVRTGDLTGSKMTLETEIGDDVSGLEFTLEVSDEGLFIISNQDIKTDAYQFDLSSVSSENDEISENSALKSNANGLSLVNIKSAESIKKGQVVFTLNTSIANEVSIENIIQDSKIFKHGSDKASSITWTVIDKRDFSNKDIQTVKMNVYPLPMQERLTIEAENITNVSLYNISGERIGIHSNITENQAEIVSQNTLPRGLYFLKVSTISGEQIVKVVK